MNETPILISTPTCSMLLRLLRLKVGPQTDRLASFPFGSCRRRRQLHRTPSCKGPLETEKTDQLADRCMGASTLFRSRTAVGGNVVPVTYRILSHVHYTSVCAGARHFLFVPTRFLANRGHARLCAVSLLNTVFNGSKTFQNGRVAI